MLSYLNVSLNDRGYPSWPDSIHGNDGPGLVRDGARVGARTSRRKFLSTKVFDVLNKEIYIQLRIGTAGNESNNLVA